MKNRTSALSPSPLSPMQSCTLNQLSSPFLETYGHASIYRPVCWTVGTWIQNTWSFRLEIISHRLDSFLFSERFLNTIFQFRFLLQPNYLYAHWIPVIYLFPFFFKLPESGPQFSDSQKTKKQKMKCSGFSLSVFCYCNWNWPSARRAPRKR